MATVKESKHNQNLDILRGIAALTVVGFHLVSCYPKAFDKNFGLGPILHYNFPGHMSVLVFFILSGYVISINTPRLANKQLVQDYVRKRLIRILPIYIVAMLFTVLITFAHYNFQTVLCNFFFVSVPFDNVIIENGPAWSLNYELFYYFVFILFSHYCISLSKTVVALAVVIAAMFVFFHNVRMYPLFLSYLIGFLFWVTGAMIAETKRWSKWQISSSRVVALFILMFCLQPFNPYGPVLKVLKLSMADYSDLSWYQQSISYTDLYYYPLTILLILALTHSYTKYYRYILWFIYGSAIFRMIMIYKVYDMNFLIREHYIVPAAMLLASVGLWLLNFNVGGKLKSAMKSVSVLGGISYGVYMIHMPLIYCFGMLFPVQSGWAFAIKLLAFIAALLFFSFLLEERFQPFIRKLLRKKPAAAVAPVNIVNEQA